jgi:hypothetical protein
MPAITLVMTTCRRYHLFTRTINSFLRACTDLHLIARWLCIDDNSDPKDRAAMAALYPFFEFIWKERADAGHARSWNILRRHGVVDTPLVLTLEDDWLFVRRMDYVSRLLAVLAQEPPEVAQVLINRHFIEVPDDGFLSLAGGALRHDVHGRRYLLHEHVPCGTPEYSAYCARYPVNWAHGYGFCFRPGLLRREVWDVVGPFNEGDVDIEEEYAPRYYAKGFRTAYLDGVYCIHIGRLNRDKFNPHAAPNAYQLLGVTQYGRHWPYIARAPKMPAGARPLLAVITSGPRVADGRFARAVRSFFSACKDPAALAGCVAVVAGGGGGGRGGGSDDAVRRQVRDCFAWFECAPVPARAAGAGGGEEGAADGYHALLATLARAAHSYTHVLHTTDAWDFGARQFAVDDAVGLLETVARDGAAQVLLRPHEQYPAVRRRHEDGTTYLLHSLDLPSPGGEDPSGDAAPPARRPLSLSLDYPGVVHARLIEIAATEAGNCREGGDADVEYAVSLRLWRNGQCKQVAMMDNTHIVRQP